MEYINLISDTVTKPTTAMLEYMLNAEVGDDVFGEDPSINRLENYVAQLFEKEAALFCPSGTMTNQIAIKLHTQPLEEIICHKSSHIYNYEQGAWALISGVSMKLTDESNGKITPAMIEHSIQADYDWLPKSSLVVVENTGNKAGGIHYTQSELYEIYKVCQKHKLKLHLDGARLFNALQVSEVTTVDVGRWFDTISICLSKGLGAPVGSLLIGSQNDIKKARRYRKALGGGMRQAGYLAAAGLYALQNHISRLQQDHDKAAQIKGTLLQLPYVTKIYPSETNILIFEISTDFASAEAFVQQLKENGVLASAFGPQAIRLVTHLDISLEDIDQVCTILSRLAYA